MMEMLQEKRNIIPYGGHAKNSPNFGKIYTAAFIESEDQNCSKLLQ